MNAEMTLVEALKEINVLNWQLMSQAIICVVVFFLMCAALVFISRRADRQVKDGRELKDNFHSRVVWLESQGAKDAQIITNLQSQLDRAERTIELLQGVKAGKVGPPPQITGSQGSEDDVIKDSIGNFGPGGGGFRL